jgi:CelD/BcsL family acetyltransferase involved in cellulose biosynthesis
VKIELHNTPALFDDLAAEWTALVTPANSLNFFMRPTWQRIWWKHLQRGDLCVLTIRDDQGALLGVAPFGLDPDTQGRLTLSVIGCIDVTDYVDLIYAPGREKEVIEAVWGFLCSSDSPGWDVLRMCSVPQSSATLAVLPELAVKDGARVAVEVEDVCPVVDLPDTYEQYLDLLDKKNRHEMRRKRRRADSYPVSWYVVGPEHAIDEEIEAFLRLMAMSTPDKATFLTQPGHREFFKEIGVALFEQGLLDLSFLTVDGQRAAAMWNYAYGDRMMLYNSGLDPQAFSALSPGIVLLSLNIEHTIQRGFKKYDFLQGDEEYKYRLGGQSTTVHNLTIDR